ncbi:MAG: alpha-galactosidase, partial [Chitinophagaceae bacterium]|nr:alpha-galactosidase [Chitinophagaceae bacterium]
MKCHAFIILLICSLTTVDVCAQADSVTLKNDLVSRTFCFNKKLPGFYTAGYKNLVTKAEYSKPGTEEFAITVNGTPLTGRNCTYNSHSFIRSGDESMLTVICSTPVTGIRIVLRYILYDGIPLIRKRLQVVNDGSSDATLFNLDVERLQFNVVDTYMNEVYANYGTHLTRVPYRGDYNDAAVLLFNLNAKQGVILGNEAPSILKRTEIYSRPNQVNIGMGMIDEPFPFKKLLAHGETFTSPQTFMYFSSSDKWQYAFEGKFQDFIREKLTVKLFQQKDPPFFIYNTWQPFFDHINEKLIRDCADSLAHTGCDLFIIDAGWYKRAGDFNADPEKFPNGMKPVCQYINSKGMRSGLWFTIGSVHNKSKIALEHPEWLIKDKNGRPENLHNGDMQEDGNEWQSAIRTMSLASGYYDHIHNVIRGYVKDWGISYLKLDLSIANSAYLHDYTRTGDYDSSGGKLYHDRASSYWMLYERVLNLMDTLKAEFPGLLLDCTFEVWGRYNAVDYALIEHADYDWLTNFDFAPPAGPISIRQMNYDRSRVIPASTLLIGNQFMNFPNYR